MNEASPTAHPLYSDKYQWKLGEILRFELKSFAGRHFFNSPPPLLQSAPALLNLGCGGKKYPGFINADFFHLRKSSRDLNFWGLDLRYPLNCEDNVWDGIFTEHTLEHLYPDQVLALLREIHRTLKPGAWVRIVVPDLAKYVAYYTGRLHDDFFQKWPLKASALRSLSQYYLHLSLWDQELMSDCLQRAGFLQIEPRGFQTGADSRLLRDTPERSPESLYLEARKAPDSSSSNPR